MKHTKTIKIFNGRIEYRLTLKNKYSILRGDSAKGKTNFCRIVLEYLSDMEERGISLINLESNVELVVFNNESDFKNNLPTLKDCLIIIDENVENILLKNLQRVRESNNYFLIISRNGVNLPYGVSDIYTFRESLSSGVVVNTLTELYSFEDIEIKPDMLLTEDQACGLNL